MKNSASGPQYEAVAMPVVFEIDHPRADSRDPRLRVQGEDLKTTGIATASYWGPEAEFFIFNSVRFDQNAFEGYYHIGLRGGHLELRPERRQPQPGLAPP